ncbi:MAG: ABC transporter substrate-binding protein [Chloroflexales bacterium]|nr:ABC transporter substrate-binding protein [Chloroflexales bacterium]
MKNRLITLFTALIAALLLAACVAAPAEEASDEAAKEIADDGEATASTEGFPVTVTDAASQEVMLEAPPERILCLLPDCIQHLAVLDVLPAAAMEFDKRSAGSPTVFGERAEEIIAFAWGDDGPDTEALLAFEPDFFVLVSDALEWAPPLATVVDTVPSYYSAGPYPDTTQWDINDPEIRETFTADLRKFGVMLGREERANAFIERLADRIAAYTKLADPTAEYARVRLETDNSIFAPPCMGLLSDMATCVSFGDEWVQTTVEALLAADPDVIFVEASPDREIDLEAWNEAPLWPELSAVQNNRVFVVTYDSFYESTPLALSNTMVPRLNSEAFPDGSLSDEEVQEILASE